MNEPPPRSGSPILTPEEKAELALRLLRELAQYDPAIAERMRALGLDPEVTP